MNPSTFFEYSKKFIQENKRSIFAFLSVGLISAIFYFLVFTLLWKILGINYKIAVSIAYVGSILLYFFANRNLTFKSSHHPVTHQFIKFMCLVILNYFLTLIIVHIVVEILTLSPYLGVVASIGLTTISNYFISKHWIFRTKFISK